MSERIQSTVDPVEAASSQEGALEASIPYSQLAREGLAKLVKAGQLTKEDAIKHHALFFPNESSR